MVPLLQNHPDLKVKYHLLCANKYCSTKAVLKDKPAQKKRHRSDESKFDSKTQCLYSGSKCEGKLDLKHPDRWRLSFLVPKAYCKLRKDYIKYMKYLVEKCFQRSDKWRDEILLKLAGVQNDIVMIY